MPRKKLGQWSIEYLSILDEEGNVDKKLEPDLEQQQLLQMYRTMLLAREADQRMLKLQRQGRVGTFGLNTGQEAISVGVATAMQERDWFVGAFRELGGRLARGEPVVNPYIFHNGYEEGNLQPEGIDRLLPLSIVVSSQTLHAAGIGYAMKYRGEPAAVVTFLGDGGTSQGDFHEALNFASVWQAPVVFVVQNNQWAISMPRAKQTRSQTLAQKAIAYEMPGIQVDGNDVLACFVAAREALERARAGQGPSLIEAVTYRLMMHTTADDPTRYRSEEEVQAWWHKEPLLRYQKYLKNRGFLDQAQDADLRQQVEAEVKGAVEYYEADHDYKPDAPFDHVFGTRHAVIEEQRAEFLANLAKETADA
jgi:pyruvate dehydrogenase E1 component alpha subunit